MPILTIQRRLREIGRIRIGQQVMTRTGKKAPQRLDRFRFTSADRAVIDAAADRYGGKPEQWAEAPVGEQWQVVTDARSLGVIVPPGDQALSQYYELWSGGGCQRRCDGEREQLGNTLCVCDPMERQCQPTTRLSIMLTALPGLGVWRLESHGYYAASELAGAVEVCAAAAGRGVLLPATLRVETRQIKRVGEPTKNFVVPVLDVALTYEQLTGGTGGALAPPNQTPTSEIADGASGSQLAALGRADDSAMAEAAFPTKAELERPAPPKQRRTPEIPPGKRATRGRPLEEPPPPPPPEGTTVERPDDRGAVANPETSTATEQPSGVVPEGAPPAVPESDSPGAGDEQTAVPNSDPAAEPPDGHLPLSPDGPAGSVMTRAQQVAIMAGFSDLGITSAMREDRLRLGSLIIGRDLDTMSHATDITFVEASMILERLTALRRGDYELVLDAMTKIVGMKRSGA